MSGIILETEGQRVLETCYSVNIFDGSLWSSFSSHNSD